MSRTVATVWHASLATLAAILYFLFVLPRWWELTGFSPHTLGTVMRVLLGVLIGAMALPVTAVLKQARKPEFGTPQLALTLLTGSIVAHAVAAVMIAGTAVSEIWLSLDDAGMWLFGIYGAAAAIALLGIGAFYLAFVAEMPPPPPKPIKPKAEKQRKRRRDKKADAAEAEDSDTDEDTGDDETADDTDETAAADETADETADAETPEGESAGEEAPETAGATADKPRPSGKRRAKKDN
ncbi:hypothetical protein [Mycolicibacter hiberniae]|uniref:Uncharacterized protein n=1 Tax=Mycolicibacter hiberniae TaxID=29314 RepID=A0A7I7X6L7_9MYCO|nr:hypothetical protein [Mycolicibacter hiberniae]MCV7085059.1 hypothetical protein [Mycolicibacter hiberniae]ORV68690.1 hypothetical protein AWC09_15175 [Mycolicibacter hiberniae]BBZ25346.1 hypothetical protein MHIB_37640 [Mycolicibacter hiberniae]